MTVLKPWNKKHRHSMGMKYILELLRKKVTVDEATWKWTQKSSFFNSNKKRGREMMSVGSTSCHQFLSSVSFVCTWSLYNVPHCHPRRSPSSSRCLFCYLFFFVIFSLFISTTHLLHSLFQPQFTHDVIA